jgi:hypothetical protein
MSDQLEVLFLSVKNEVPKGINFVRAVKSCLLAQTQYIMQLKEQRIETT